MGIYKKISKTDYLAKLDENKERKDVRNLHYTSSYETAIRSTINFFSWLWVEWNIWKNIRYKNIANKEVELEVVNSWNTIDKYLLSYWNHNTPPKFYKIDWNSKNQLDVLDLWVLEQSLLFLADTFERWINKQDKVKFTFLNILKWDKNEVVQFYNLFHNTDPNQYDNTAKEIIESSYEQLSMQKNS